MEIVIKSTKKKQIIDITDIVNDYLVEFSDKAILCNLFIKHTTAALTTADLDPGTDLDMLDAFEVMVPKLKYRHPHNPAHVGDHIISSLLGSSVLIPISEGALDLGTWQRVVLVELDGPKTREVIMKVI